ncbi:MAG: glycosyltransferase family 2 protein [Glaciimonas sp.]|nr:glycosyltransferase family 2 protein [Glaciimonas sp.]
MQHETIKKLVSIGLPTYNRPDALRKMLEIVVAQTYPNLEIIISDNASPDAKVKEVIEEFSSKDSRIKHYWQDENIGVLANAEFVLRQAQGEYFTWFSDDDWRSPEFIELLVEELEKNKNVDFAFCDYREVFEDGSRATAYPSSHFKIFKPFTSNSRLIRTIAYYWQDAARGKPNIFYSVFRREALAALDIKKITDGYKLLNMDCLIAFTLLQKSPVVIRREVMCTLTCGNKKYYSSVEQQLGKPKLALLSKLVNFWSENKYDRDLYIKKTNRFIEKLMIYILFAPKLTFLLSRMAINKFEQGNKPNNGESDQVTFIKSPVKLDSVKRVETNLKIQLPNVTLLAMSTVNVEEHLQALVYSCRGIEFGSVKLLSNYKPYGMDSNIEYIRTEEINDIDYWCYKAIYDLNQHVDTEFMLLVHADGFVVNPSSWNDEFLNYDYIGAPWPLPTDDFSYRDINGKIVRVGNSVSLRSKKLLELPIKLNLPWEPFHGNFHEDGFICVKNKHIYESHGMRFAPLEVAKYFSHETMIPEVRDIKPFVFHKWAGSNSIYPKF